MNLQRIRKYEDTTYDQLGKEERLSVGMGLRNGYLEVFEFSSKKAACRYLEICTQYKIRAIFCEHGQEQSSVWYYKDSINETPPEDITKNEHLYESDENRIRIFVRNREQAKNLASRLNLKFNSTVGDLKD